MHASHWPGVSGLVANMIGTVLLLWFPPVVKIFNQDGSEQVVWIRPPSADGIRRYTIQIRGFRLAVALLFLGFFLQWLDMLIS